MATYTPNLNLYKPDSSDNFGDFRSEFNDNMDKIDNAPTGDSVSYTQTLATGSKVGEITINGTSADINAPRYDFEVITSPMGNVWLNLFSQDLLWQHVIDTALFIPYLTVSGGVVCAVFDDGN